MHRTKNMFLAALTLAAFSASAWAQTSSPITLASNGEHGAAASSPAPAPTPPPAPSAVTAADVQALKDALAAQQLQIDRLTQQLQRQQAQSAVEAEGKTSTTKASAVPEQQVAEIHKCARAGAIRYAPEMERVLEESVLLLHRKEIDQLVGAVERKGYTLVPTAMYWKGNKVKVEIGLAAGDPEIAA